MVIRGTIVDKHNANGSAHRADAAKQRVEECPAAYIWLPHVSSFALRQTKETEKETKQIFLPLKERGKEIEKDRCRRLTRCFCRR